MKLNELKPNEGSKKKRKRVGRGISAGQGKTAGRGMKGQNARAGGGTPLWHQGGNLPFFRRLPFKRGFTPPNRVEYSEVNLDRAALKNAFCQVYVTVFELIGVLVSKQHRHRTSVFSALRQVAGKVTPDNCLELIGNNSDAVRPPAGFCEAKCLRKECVQSESCKKRRRNRLFLHRDKEVIDPRFVKSVSKNHVPLGVGSILPPGSTPPRWTRSPTC